MNARSLASLLAAAAIFSFAPTAAAVDEFPESIGYYLQLSYLPPCRVCHVQGKTGSGTIETPFGVSMLAHGLSPQDPYSMLNALEAMKNEKVDSDGDGVPDIDELKAGTDPNTPADATITGDDAPTNGCGSNAPGTERRPPPGAPGAAILGLLAFARRRKR